MGEVVLKAVLVVAFALLLWAFAVLLWDLLLQEHFVSLYRTFFG